MPNYMKEPAMQEAANEIREILRKHNLMGGVVLCSETRSGWVHEMSPSWSCVVADESTGEIRVKCKYEDYSSKAEQSKHLASSIGGLMGMLSSLGAVTETLGGLVTLIGTKVQISHVQSDMVVQRMQADLAPSEENRGIDYQCQCAHDFVDPLCPQGGKH